MSPLLVLFAAHVARAQGIDCGRAHTSVEKSICASPHLLALDHRVTLAYAGASARAPDRQAALRQDQLGWLKQRDAACAASSQIETCLDAQLSRRLAALTTSDDVLAPRPAAPSAPGPAPASDPAPRDPPIPSGGPAPPAATVAPAIVPAARVATATLTVTSPGRFIVAAHSRSGAALQLVDMLTGPSDMAGEAGATDGRIDTLLDAGIYRLRVFAAAGATDPIGLAVTPFHDAAPRRAAPGAGRMVVATLRDAEQRGFWLAVPDGRLPPIEAAGRSLADLRLWRNGRDLQPIEPIAGDRQPTPGHPLHDLRLEGKVEPGTYLLVAYGGPPLAWGDGDGAPFLLRIGATDALGEGLATGTIGPFGSERFRQPAFAGRFRLELPTPADAVLQVGEATATISPRSRVPAVSVAVTPSSAGIVEISGKEGQPYSLRATEAPGPQTLSSPGSYWVSAVTSGAGGDEVPPTVLLQRGSTAADPDRPPRIVASDVPTIGAASAWRRRFNLTGPTELILRTTAGGDVAIRTDGLKLDRAAPAEWFDAPAGYHGLRLQPAPGAAGALDLTVGGTGAAALGPPLPADPVIPLGLQTLGDGEQLTLLAQTAPDAETGLSARRVPVELAAAPLFVSQETGGTPLRIPVRLAQGGALAARSLDGAAVAVSVDPASAPDAPVVSIPAAPAPRTVVLSWQRSAPLAIAPIPDPEPPTAGTALVAGQPAPFDLREKQERSFALTVGTGGLYRVETAGRLQMRGRLATAFIPNLAHDDAGGPGGSLLIQSWLRAGAYRVAVAPVGSAGHGALTVTPVPLLAGATLTAGGRVHANLPAGSGIAFPLLIERPGRYRLEVLSQGRPPVARLDDSDGWPITRAGSMAALEQDLEPGRDRLLVSTAGVSTVVAARLLPVDSTAASTGHGPHPLAAGTPQQATWREPATPGAPRTPDSWTFALDGPAHATVTLGDGMDGTLIGPGGLREHVAIQWAGELPAGSYRLEASSVGRNDRLDYTVGFSTDELQPGEARAVRLPATLPFSLATERVVNLSGWGAPAVKAVLKRDDGTELLRAGPRADNWSLDLSRRLPAGRYLLELSAAVPPDTASVPQDPGLRSPLPADEAADTGTSDSGSDANGDAGSDTDSEAAATDTPPDAPADAPGEPDAPAADDVAGPGLAVRLDLPPLLPATEAPSTAAALPGSGVHVLTLPTPGPGALLVAAASGAGASVLSLERQDGALWRTVAVSTGTAPRVALPGDGTDAHWRLEAWLTDGGSTTLSLAARVLNDAGTALEPLSGFPVPLAVARRPLADRRLLRVDAAPDGMLAASGPGRPATTAGGQIAPLGDTLWLLAATQGPLTLSPADPSPGVPLSVSVPAGGQVLLAPQPAANGHARFWLAESGLGQPGFVGQGASAEGSALASAAAPVRLRHADGDAPLAAQVTLLDLAAADTAGIALPFHVQIPAHGAFRVRLLAPTARLRAVLSPGTALLSATGCVWTSRAAVARDLVGASGTLTLVNTGAQPAAATLLAGSADIPDALRPGTVFKRFFGAAGSFDLPVDAAAGSRIAVAGHAGLRWTGLDGSVLRGTAVSPGAASGRLVVEHGPGALVLSMEAAGRSPWPQPAAHPLPANGQVTLSGAAAAWRLQPDAPALLNVSTTAPVLLALGDAPPELFGAGAELHRTIAAGTTELRAYSPDDGPLAGTLTLDLSPPRMIGNGVGPVTSVAPGGAALFGFDLARAAAVGVAVRANPDRIRVRLLRADGTLAGEGVAQLRALPPGRYLIEASVPADAAPTVLRPAVLGLDVAGRGPPPDIVQHYLELAGLKGSTP